jgi:hypothetical protein
MVGNAIERSLSPIEARNRDGHTCGSSPNDLVRSLADLLGYHPLCRWSDLQHFDWHAAGRIFEARVCQIQAQHVQKCVEQSVNNLGRLGSAPHGWKRENANQVVQAGLQALRFTGRKFPSRIHLRLCQAHVDRLALSSRTLRRNSSGGTKNGLL